MEQFPDHVAEAALLGVSAVFSGASLEQLAEIIRKPLEFAAAEGKLPVFLGIMKVVVKGGAQLAGYRGEGDRTMFDAAALGGCADIVSSLLRAGAMPGLNVVSASSRRSALYLATSLSHENAACCWARAGADVSFHDPVDRRDVLSMAADKGLGELVGLLLVGGASPTAHTKKGGYSPLQSFTAAVSAPRSRSTRTRPDEPCQVAYRRGVAPVQSRWLMSITPLVIIASARCQNPLPRRMESCSSLARPCA